MTLTIERRFQVKNGHKGSKKLHSGEAPAEAPVPGRVPRVARLLALAHRFERLIRTGEVSDQAELARLGHVSRARVTQIMSLLNLAPDIQEEILLLPRTIQGRDPVRERMLRPLVAELGWGKQRRMWVDRKMRCLR